MREPYTQLYLHLVWATWDRMPLIRAELQQPIYACIHEQVTAQRCDPIAIGGISDHVHLLLRLHPTATIAEVVRRAKGASSHLVTHVLEPGGFFKWQGYYGVFTISKQQVPHVRDYINRQEQHHLGGTTLETLERISFPGNKPHSARYTAPPVRRDLG